MKASTNTLLIYFFLKIVMEKMIERPFSFYIGVTFNHITENPCYKI